MYVQGHFCLIIVTLGPNKLGHPLVNQSTAPITNELSPLYTDHNKAKMLERVRDMRLII